MKLSLSISERNVLNGLLAPMTGNMMTLKVVREAREALSFTDEEVEEWTEPCSEEPSCTRRPETCRHRDKEIVFGKRLVKTIAEVLKQKDSAKQLTPDMYTLVEKFCPELVEEDEEKPIPALRNGE
jgi:hypothetical protein